MAPTDPSTIRLARLRLYPVKGLRGYDCESLELERCGFVGDRRWMVTDPDGMFLTQRQVPAMARIDARCVPGGLGLAAESQGGIEIPLPGPNAERLDVTVWRDTVPAVLADSAAAAWLSAVLGRPCRLVHMVDPAARPVDPDYARPDDRVSFADGFPVLLTSETSLADLNTRLAAPIPILRFRPNLMVSGSTAWAEDRWRRIRIGEAIFRIAKPCSRCIVTTTDQETGERPVPDEPLRTLGTFRRARGGVMFGQNLVPETLGRVAVGDAAAVLEEGPTNLLPAA